MQIVERGILEAALIGLEVQRARTDILIAAVQKQLSGRSKPGKIAVVARAKGKRELSPEARERIAAAQKKRWAAYRKEKKAAA